MNAVLKLHTVTPDPAVAPAGKARRTRRSRVAHPTGALNTRAVSPLHRKRNSSSS
jgi:hypothetical protein